MQKIHLSILIRAPRQNVWDIMLNDATYREWTKVFHPGSFYRGSWDQGAKILFLGPEKDGQGESGMVSRIAENRLYEYISIEHRGFIANGVEDTESEAVRDWAGIHENYTFIEKDRGTELVVDMDINDSEKEAMEEMWKKALERLKEMAEGTKK